MAMTSAQVKTALKQMADFSAAVLRAGEILESVEAAEYKLKTMDKDIAAKEKRLEGLGSAEDDWKARSTKAQADFDGFLQELNRRRDQMEHSLDGVKRQLAEQQDALRHVVAEKEKAVADLNAQLKEKQGALAKVQAEIDRLKKAFAA